MSGQCAILAGGLATRLKSYSEGVAKSMLEFEGKPFLEYQLELLERNGISEVVLCLGHLGEQVESYFGKVWNGIDIRYSFEGKELLGTGGALRQAADILNDDFFVLYGDAYLDIDYRRVYDQYRVRGFPALMTVFRNDNRWGPSNAIFEDGMVKLYDKEHPTPAMKHIDFGISVVSKGVILEIPQGTHFDLAELYNKLSLEKRLAGYEVSKRFYEIGSLSGIEDFKKFTSENRTGL